MKIRSITCFIDPSYPLDGQKLITAGEFLQIAQPAFVESGYEVQSSRLATIPFTNLLPVNKLGGLARLAHELEVAAGELGYAYVCLGPALPSELESYPIHP